YCADHIHRYRVELCTCETDGCVVLECGRQRRCCGATHCIYAHHGRKSQSHGGLPRGLSAALSRLDNHGHHGCCHVGDVHLRRIAAFSPCAHLHTHRSLQF